MKHSDIIETIKRHEKDQKFNLVELRGNELELLAKELGVITKTYSQGIFLYQAERSKYFVYDEIEFREQNDPYLKPGHITLETSPRPSTGVMFSTVEVLSDNEFKIKTLLE